ncbi:hypothetical protein FA13DRAFT_1809183 [Coprinellus micaceus]|uniref:F-box domain-containing protein n=1 Tax=Coprinellus micaceus TaxID=71717 RepID=A0A4Y7TUV4_COPMI|nr:hypothetical protein FA13DRAFT_1809183 [Coprinellus micaceus]
MSIPSLRQESATDNGVQPPPIHRLSDDLLASIVSEVLKVTNTAELLISPTHPLINATHVSHSWRRVLLDSALLWTDIRIVTPSPVPPPQHDPKEGDCVVDVEVLRSQWTRQMKVLPELVTTWINRSSTCPISLFLNMHAPLSRYASPETREIIWPYYVSTLSAICNASSKWKDVTLHISLDSPDLSQAASLIHGLQSSDVPLLEALSMRLSSASGGGDTRHIPTSANGIQMGSALLSLRIPYTECRWEDYHANWSALTSLEVLGFTLETSGTAPGTPAKRMGLLEVLALLRACPNLVKLSMQINRRHPVDTEEELSAAQPVELPRLRTLVFSMGGLPPWAHLACYLVLPALRELQFHSDVDMYALKHWVSVFGKGLTSVRLVLGRDVSTEDVEEILDRLPNVRSLRCMTESCAVGTDALVLRTLTPKYTPGGYVVGTCRCPKLENILYAQRDQIPESTILDFVESRRNVASSGVAMLEEVYTWSGQTDALTSDLEAELRKRGVNTGGLSITMAPHLRNRLY